MPGRRAKSIARLELPLLRHLLPFAALLLAVALRITRLAASDFWVDEANSVIMAQQSLTGLVERLRLDSSPPLYYLILRAWMTVFGNGETAVRAISVIAGVAIVALVFLVGRRLFSREVGIVAAVLMAASPVQICYSQQARMYSLLALTAWLSFYWLWRAASDHRARYVIGYGVATLASLYLHNWALYLLPAHLVALLWMGELRKEPLRWLVAIGCVVAAYLPWVPVLVAQLHNKTQYAWFIPFWQDFGVTGSLVQTLISFSPGGQQPPYVLLAGISSAAWVPPVLTSVAAGLSVICVFRPALHGPGSRLRVGWLLSCVCMPLGAGLAASCVVTPNYVPGRTDQLVFPGFILLVAVGLSSIRPRVLRYGFLATLLAFSAAGLREYFSVQSPQSDRAMAHAIEARAGANDAIVTTNLTRASLEYYTGRDGAPVSFFSFPQSTGSHLGNQDDASLLTDPDELVANARRLKAEIERQCGPHARVFVVLAETPINRVLYRELVESGSNEVENIGTFEQAVTGIPVDVLLLQ